MAKQDQCKEIKNKLHQCQSVKETLEQSNAELRTKLQTKNDQLLSALGIAATLVVGVAYQEMVAATSLPRLIVALVLWTIPLLFLLRLVWLKLPSVKKWNKLAAAVAVVLLWFLTATVYAIKSNHRFVADRGAEIESKLSVDVVSSSSGEPLDASIKIHNGNSTPLTDTYVSCAPRLYVGLDGREKLAVNGINLIGGWQVSNIGVNQAETTSCMGSIRPEGAISCADIGVILHYKVSELKDEQQAKFRFFAVFSPNATEGRYTWISQPYDYAHSYCAQFLKVKPNEF